VPDGTSPIGKRAGTWFYESPLLFIGVETMSVTRAVPGSLEGVPADFRRVRHQARDVAAVMGFSAGMSVSLSLVLLILTSLGR
jgi:hypothetical protein